MNHSLEYWKKRCELAEKFIYESPVDPDVTLNQMKAFHQWRDFKNISNAAIEPEEHFLSHGVNEILALEAYLGAMKNAMSKVGILTPGRVEDFDNLLMHVNNLKKLAGIFVETNTVDASGAMIIPNPMHDNFRGKYPFIDLNELNPLVGMIPDPTSLFDDINAKPSEEEREHALKFIDKTIPLKDNSKGFTFGYRVHESEIGVPSRLHEPEETTNGIYPPIEFLTSFLSEKHQENAKRIDEMFFIPDELSSETEQVREIIKDNFPGLNLKEKGTCANGEVVTPSPVTSFSEFAKTFFPKNKISLHHEQIIEKLNKIAGTPAHLIMQGVRPINWYKSLAAMQETVIKLKEGKKCYIAMVGKGNYIKQMKEFFYIDIELEELSENIYNIKLINKEE